MNSPVQKIKERLSIEEVVSSYIKLEKVGSSLKARCPFHNEKTPSFFVSVDRGNYYCFGCGAKGDIFTFVEEFEGLDFRGALKLLAERAGVPLEEYNPKEEGEKEKLYRAMEEATKYFCNNLNENIEVSNYIKNRGVEEKTIKDFKIGFAKNEWRELYAYLQKKGFSELEMEKAGLIKKVPEKQGYYDRFRGRIMFPIADSSGRIIAFSGRLFEKSVPTLGEVGKPTSQVNVGSKYLNSPETQIFNKSNALYGLDKAKDSIRKNNFSILVEGQFDLVLSHQAGFRNTIATSGTALSDAVISKENVVSSLGLVLRLSKNILLAFDSDKAGVNATIRAGKIALSLGMDVKAVSMPDGVDPADLISKNGNDAWRETIRNGKHLIEFLLEKVLKNFGNDPRKIGREIKERILPYVNVIESSIEKAYFIKKISDSTQISEQALIDDLKQVEKELKYEKEEIKVALKNIEKKVRKDQIERRLLGIAYWQEGKEDKKIDPELIFKKLEKTIEKYKDNKEDLIFEVEEFYSDQQDLGKDVKEMLLSIEEEYLNEEFVKYMLLLQNLKGKEEEIEILKKIDEITKKKEEIKNGRLYK